MGSLAPPQPWATGWTVYFLQHATHYWMRIRSKYVLPIKFAEFRNGFYIRQWWYTHKPIPLSTGTVSLWMITSRFCNRGIIVRLLCFNHSDLHIWFDRGVLFENAVERLPISCLDNQRSHSAHESVRLGPWECSLHFHRLKAVHRRLLPQIQCIFPCREITEDSHRLHFCAQAWSGDLLSTGEEVQQ